MDKMRRYRREYQAMPKGYYHLCTDGWKEGAYLWGSDFLIYSPLSEIIRGEKIGAMSQSAVSIAKSLHFPSGERLRSTPSYLG